jgi:hypothetical protein
MEPVTFLPLLDSPNLQADLVAALLARVPGDAHDFPELNGCFPARPLEKAVLSSIFTGNTDVCVYFDFTAEVPPRMQGGRAVCWQLDGRKSFAEWQAWADAVLATTRASEAEARDAVAAYKQRVGKCFFDARGVVKRLDWNKGWVVCDKVPAVAPAPQPAHRGLAYTPARAQAVADARRLKRWGSFEEATSTYARRY